MKPNFKCPKCKHMIAVGKSLHSSYTCPNCHTQMVIDREERSSGHKKYLKNFFIR